MHKSFNFDEVQLIIFLFMAAFALQWQSLVVVAETVWLAKTKIFTI